MKIKDIIAANFKRQKLLIDININCVTGSPTYYRMETWTTKKTDEIICMGYKKCVGLHDNLLWLDIDQYIRINNGCEFDIHQKDKYGNFIYSQDTPATLNDAMTSDSDATFIKGMGRAHTLRGMDLQTLIMIAIVGAGAIAGMYFLGVI